MATPRSVRYSPVVGSPADLMKALGDILERLDISIDEVGQLGREATGELAFAGGTVKCSNVDQALELALPWGDFAVRTWAEEPNQAAYLYWWWEQESWHFAIELESPLVYYEKGEWLRKFLISVMGVIRTQVCAFGSRYEPGLFLSLEPTALVNDLRSGIIFHSFPHFYMVALELVSTEEVKAAVERVHSPRLRYQCTTSGYHVLSEL